MVLRYLPHGEFQISLSLLLLFLGVYVGLGRKDWTEVLSWNAGALVLLCLSRSRLTCRARSMFERLGRISMRHGTLGLRRLILLFLQYLFHG